MLKAAITAALLVSLTACVTPSGNDGRPGDGTTVIRMSRIGADKVQYRHVDAVNAIRQSRGLAPVALNAALITAAQRHAAQRGVVWEAWRGVFWMHRQPKWVLRITKMRTASCGGFRCLVVKARHRARRNCSGKVVFYNAMPC